MQEGRASSVVHLCLDDPRVAGEVVEGLVIPIDPLARLEAGNNEGASNKHVDGRCYSCPYSGPSGVVFATVLGPAVALGGVGNGVLEVWS